MNFYEKSKEEIIKFVKISNFELFILIFLYRRIIRYRKAIFYILKVTFKIKQAFLNFKYLKKYNYFIKQHEYYKTLIEKEDYIFLHDLNFILFTKIGEE